VDLSSYALNSTISNVSGRTVDVLNSGYLLFTVVNSTTRRLDNYIESGTKYTVRSAQFTNSKLELSLATFSPSFSINSVSPSTSPNWDQPITSFVVSGQNPSDFTSQWISGVYYFTGAGLTTTGITGFVPSAASPTPAGGVSWSQSWATGAVGKIYSNTLSGATGYFGGTAQISAYFVDNNNTNNPSWVTTTPVTINWQNFTNTINFNLPTIGFLQTITSVTFTTGANNISAANVLGSTITATSGTIVNSTGFAFTNPIHKDDYLNRNLTMVTTGRRPAFIANGGTGYTAIYTGVKNSSAPTVNYYDLLILGGDTLLDTDVYGNTTNKLASTVNILNTYTSVSRSPFTAVSNYLINNIGNPSKTLYVGVPAASAQPSSFKVATTLADTPLSLVMGATIVTGLKPTGAALALYNTVNYNFYTASVTAGYSGYLSIS
jgi:hypothetical protein